MPSSVHVRPYQQQDYHRARELFADGISSSHWITCCRMLFTNPGRSCFWIQVATAIIIYCLTPNVYYFVVAESFALLVLFILVYVAYDDYTRHALATDLKDPDFSYWTSKGAKEGGFFVAVLEGKVVGTISYKKVNEHVMEIFRLSVDKNFRKLGIGRHLVNAVIEVCLKFGLTSLSASTSAPQTNAMAYYYRDGWEEVKRYPHSNYTYYIFGLEIVEFNKKVEKLTMM